MIQMDKGIVASQLSSDWQNFSHENSNGYSRKSENKKRDKEEHLDTFKKSGAMTDSIEEQIRQQRAKIQELSESLALLQDDYDEKRDAKYCAINEKYKAKMDKKHSDAQKNYLNRMMKNLFEKNIYGTDFTKNYDRINRDLKESTLENQNFEDIYNQSVENSYLANKEYNSVHADYLGKLWVKDDACYDLLRLQKFLMIANCMNK